MIRQHAITYNCMYVTDPERRDKKRSESRTIAQKLTLWALFSQKFCTMCDFAEQEPCSKPHKDNNTH